MSEVVDIDCEWDGERFRPKQPIALEPGVTYRCVWSAAEWTKAVESSKAAQGGRITVRGQVGMP